MQNDEEEVVHYLTDEEEPDKASTKNSIQQALRLAGAWKDRRNWDDVLDAMKVSLPPIELRGVICLDTTMMTAYLHQGEAATSSLVYGELIEHIMGRADYAQHRDELRELLQEIAPYSLTLMLFWNAMPKSDASFALHKDRI